MLLDDVKAAYAALANGMPGAAQIILGDAILAAEREPPADGKVEAVLLACADIVADVGDVVSMCPDAVEVEAADRIVCAVGLLDEVLGIPHTVSYAATADALRALASAQRPQSADRLVGEVAPAVPAVEPVAVAGAATLADVHRQVAALSVSVTLIIERERRLRDALALDLGAVSASMSAGNLDDAAEQLAALARHLSR